MNGGNERPRPHGSDPIDRNTPVSEDIPDLIFPERILPTAEEVEAARKYAPLELGEKFSAEGSVLSDAVGRIRLTLPNPKLIAALQGTDGGERIDVFDDSVLTRGPDGGLVTPDGNYDGRFLRAVSTPLVEQVLKDFPGETAFLGRGIAASINGPVYDESKGILVKDIRQILQEGAEQAGDGMLLAGLGVDSENRPAIHERINQYLISGQSSLRRSLPSEIVGTIFPTLLVYDRAKVTAGGGYYYSLPDDPAERVKCIRRAYILPRPEYY